MKMKCYIIRHGITAGNKELNFNGCRTDEPLSAEGRAAVKAIDASEGISDEALLFVSPMKRARETASIMFPGKEQTAIDDLREMDFGMFEGKNHHTLDGDPDYQAWLDSGGYSKIPGGESIMEFRERAGRGFREAVRQAAAQGAETLCIVAHGGTIMAVMNIVTGEDYFTFNAPNGAGYSIDLEVGNDFETITADAYDRFCGGLSDGPDGWRPPRYTPSDRVDRQTDQQA